MESLSCHFEKDLKEMLRLVARKLTNIPAERHLPATSTIYNVTLHVQAILLGAETV